MAAISEKRREIFEYVDDHWGASPQEVARELDRSPGAVRKMMHDMYHDDQLERVERGRYAVPGYVQEVQGPAGGFVLIDTEHQLAGQGDHSEEDAPPLNLKKRVQQTGAVLGTEDRVAKDLQKATGGLRYWWGSFVYSLRQSLARKLWNLYEFVAPHSLPDPISYDDD